MLCPLFCFVSELSLWDLRDGRCIEHNKSSGLVHTCMQTYQMMHCRDARLVCNGYYPDIHIIQPLTLETLFTLSSRMQPDWVSALCILRPVKREGEKRGYFSLCSADLVYVET